MDNGCKTYQQATQEMVWLGTQSRSIDVIHAVADPEVGARGGGGAPPLFLDQTEVRMPKKSFLESVPPSPHRRHYIKVWIRHWHVPI